MTKSDNEKDHWSYGYIAGNWVWTQAIYEARQAARNADEFMHLVLSLYDVLAPASEQHAMHMSDVITSRYSNNRDMSKYVYQISHEEFRVMNPFSDTTGGEM